MLEGVCPISPANVNVYKAARELPSETSPLVVCSDNWRVSRVIFATGRGVFPSPWVPADNCASEKEEEEGRRGDVCVDRNREGVSVRASHSERAVCLNPIAATSPTFY